MNPFELLFPGLVGSGYAITSPATDDYNCIGWAAGESDRWWWPDPMGVGYWPPGVPREETLSVFQAAYATLGFTPTVSHDSEPKVVKIVVYARSGQPTHAARQLPNGRWTSKLGVSEDIEHALTDLVGTIYGDVALILARPVSDLHRQSLPELAE